MVVRQTLDAQCLRRLEKGGEVLLVDGDLAVVDELHDALQVREGHVAEDDHGVLPRMDVLHRERDARDDRDGRLARPSLPERDS